jgi:hypothetical protein
MYEHLFTCVFIDYKQLDVTIGASIDLKGTICFK